MITTYSCAWTLGGDFFLNDGSIPQTCVSNLASAHVPVDCGKLALCLDNVCACTASSCTSEPAIPDGSTPAQYPVELDAALDATGTTLTGTLNLAGTRVTVVLTKQ